MEIRRSYDRLISTMGFSILVRCYLYIESGLSISFCFIECYLYFPNIFILNQGPEHNVHPFVDDISNIFPWMKTLAFRFQFQWRLFLKVQLTIKQRWFRQWLGAEHQAITLAITLANDDEVQWRIYASPCFSELIEWSFSAYWNTQSLTANSIYQTPP